MDREEKLIELDKIKQEKQEKVDAGEGLEQQNFKVDQTFTPKIEQSKFIDEKDIETQNKYIEDAAKNMLDAALSMEKAIISLEKIFIKDGKNVLKDSLSELYSLKDDIKKMSETILKYKF